MSDWKQRALENQKSNDWKQRALENQPDSSPQETVGADFGGIDKWKARLKGAAQGATFDYYDEIAAGIKSGLESVATGKDYDKLYRSQIQKERQELKRLEEKYPLDFISSELSGAVATGLLIPIPGSSAVRGATVGAKLTRGVGRLLPEALLQASGESEAEIGTKQYYADLAKGTTTGVIGGALLGGAGSTAGALLEKGKGVVSGTAKVLSNILFDLPHHYTEKLLDPKSVQKILNPKSTSDIADEVADLVTKAGEHSKALSLKAAENLSTDKNIPLASVIEEIQNLPVVTRLQTSTMPEAQKAKDALKEAITDLTTKAGDSSLLSERQIKTFIQDLDDEIPWNTADWSKKDTIYSGIRSHLDHNLLKQNNEAYRQAMDPVSKLESMRKDVSKSFSLKRYGYKLTPSDQTYSKINNFFTQAGLSKKPVTEMSLEEAKKFFPDKDILSDIDAKMISERSMGGVTAGSRNTLGGILAGQYLGQAPGMVALGALGYVKDKYGRRMGQYVVPKVSPVVNVMDELTRRTLGPISKERLGRAGTILGRQRSVGLGVEEEERPPILIPNK